MLRLKGGVPLRWFTFDRTPGEKMDPDEFQNRALQAATLAGLVDSPSPGEWLRNINVPDDGRGGAP